MGTDYQELLHDAIHRLKVATGNERITTDALPQTVSINGTRFHCIVKRPLAMPISSQLLIP